MNPDETKAVDPLPRPQTAPAPQVTQINLPGSVAGAGTAATGISDSVANRRPDQALPGQARLSPGNQLAPYIEAHAAGGQAGTDATRQYVDNAIPPAPGEQSRDHYPTPREDADPVPPPADAGGR